MEYNLLNDGSSSSVSNPNALIHTKLLDKHEFIFSPISYECESYIDPSSNIRYKKRFDPDSLNTLNHIAIPKDSGSSMYYYFSNPDYSYVNENIFEKINDSDIVAKEYAKYLINPTDENKNPFEYVEGLKCIGFDTIRLYFVNGYDFSDLFGAVLKIYIDKNTDGEYLDLCNFLITKDTYFRTAKYLSSPIIFGNNIYDRYVELNIPCVYDLMNKESEDETGFIKSLNIKNSPTIKLQFFYIEDSDAEFSDIDHSIVELYNLKEVKNDNVNCTFIKSSNVKGTIPTQNIVSDNLGAYVAECPDIPYITFYGTWKDEPLTKDVVWQFNKTIKLYDTSLVKKRAAYEIDDDYVVQHDMRKWVVVHDINCKFCNGSSVLKEEKYNMSQIFATGEEDTVFYYRPMLFDTGLALNVNNIQIVYTMRFINAEDNVQFIKTASIALADNLSRFYTKGTNLSYIQTTPYYVFNRIVEAKNEMSSSAATTQQKTKYIKLFYDSTTITLNSEGIDYEPYSYTLKMSDVPKSYKFVFRKQRTNGNYGYMDLTSGYYKLLFKNSSGTVVMIDPTYSSNMNLYVGELEFSITSSHINALNSVSDSERKMSIVMFNDDNSYSSMYDFMYDI